MRPGRLRIFLLGTLVVAFGGLAGVVFTDTQPRLGLDLEGGISVILTASSEEGVDPNVLDETVEILRRRIDALGVAEPEVTAAGSENILVQLPGLEDEEKALELIGTTAQLTFRQVEEIYGPETPEKDLPEVTEDVGDAATDEEVVYPSGEDDQAGTLYRLKPAVLTGDVVTDADAVIPQGQPGGGWVVTLEMNDEGARGWEEFTGKLACLRDQGDQVKSRAAVVLDGRVEAAPTMGEGVQCDVGITGGGGTEISVGGSETEAKNLALVLRTGSLPLTLEQSQVSKVSPTLGRDSLTAGLIAGAVGLGFVMFYVLLYYRALGLVVWLGLIIFTAIFYTILSLLGETAGLSLSLAGVAGIIVAIGITADSYIVAFERLKDEVRSGKSIKAAVERGMKRAFKTIIVADTVTGAAALILFWLAVGPVRGFALTLGLATLIDVLVAYFFTRSAVGLLARRKFFAEGRLFGLKDALGAQA